jgi:RES domain-containing protein
MPIVYTAGSPALAALEVLVHVDPLCAPADLRLLAIDLPPDLSMEVIDPGALPQGWGDLPAPAELQALGTAWLRSNRTAALSVPSAVIRVEHNILLNPRHSEATRWRLISDEPFSFDPRLP